MSNETGFWERRRAAVAAEERAELTALEAEALLAEQAALEEKTDDELLLELNLPVPETLKAGDDFTVFMARAVPERLRRRALRILWRSNPVLACVDNLVDYGEDYTDAAMVKPDMKTSYQVGKGLLRHVQEMARQAEAKENPVEPEAVEETLIVQAEPETVLEAVEEKPVQASASREPETEPSPAPRRMKFRKEATA